MQNVGVSSEENGGKKLPLKIISSIDSAVVESKYTYTFIIIAIVRELHFKGDSQFGVTFRLNAKCLCKPVKNKKLESHLLLISISQCMPCIGSVWAFCAFQKEEKIVIDILAPSLPRTPHVHEFAWNCQVSRKLLNNILKQNNINRHVRSVKFQHGKVSSCCCS